MAGNYVSKFGESLRRLAALDAGMSGQGPVLPGGPSPVTGAFELSSGLSPKDDMAAAAPAFQQAQEPAPAAVPAGAFGTAEKAAAPPISAGQMIEDLSDEEKEEVVAGLKERTGKTVDELYDEMVKSGEIAPPAKKIPTAKEKLPRLAEALLRFAAHMGRGADGGEASALATLETGQRRSAMEQAEIERQRTEETQRRGEVTGVLAARKARTEKKEDTKDERAYEDQKAKDAHERAKELEKLRARLQKEQEKGRNLATIVEADGTVLVWDKDADPSAANLTPAEKWTEEEVVVTPGQRGKPPLTEKRKVKKPVRTSPRADASGLDQDKLVWARVEAEKLVRGDASMKQIAREARDTGTDVETLVQQRIEAVAQRMIGGSPGSTGPASSGSDVLDIGLD